MDYNTIKPNNQTPAEAFFRVQCVSEQQWLIERARGLGGSDAATVMGLNPYKNNEELWREKTGRKQADDISSKACVQYGKKAEASLRQLFKLDFPDYKLKYRNHLILRNKKFPWLQASLDGELVDPAGRKGILEIKTTQIMRSMHREKWVEKVPENYYCQVLHYLLVTGWEFAILKAQLKSEYKNSDIYLATKHYFFERDEVLGDLKALFKAELSFWQQVEQNKRPAGLILPAI